MWERSSGDTIAISNVRGRMMLASFVKDRPVPEGWDVSPPRPGWRVQHGPPDDGDDWGIGPPEREWRFAGLWYRAGQQLWFRCRSLHVPDWMLLLATAVLPGLWYRRWRRDRRAAWRERNGRCVRCGYDLRATPGRCPECGGTKTEERVLGLRRALFEPEPQPATSSVESSRRQSSRAEC